MLQINFTPFPTLLTNRVILRQIIPGDAKEIFFLRSDETIMKYLDRPRAKSIEEAVAYIEKITGILNKNEGITWAITLKGQTKLMGTVGFWRIEKKHYRAEAGYTLHTALQGKGIMQEALTAALDYGFNTMQLHSVEANVNPDNLSSIKLLERSNFTKEAHFKENYFYDGKFLDSAVYSLLKSGFKKI